MRRFFLTLDIIDIFAQFYLMKYSIFAEIRIN